MVVPASTPAGYVGHATVRTGQPASFAVRNRLGGLRLVRSR
jgi:hypothetical protein